MRSIVTILFLAFYFLPVSLVVLPIMWVYGKFQPEKAEMATLAVIRWGFRAVCAISGARVTVSGAENIPKDRPVLYVSNHRSFYDIVIGYPLTVGRCGFIAKDSMKKIPVISTWMRRVHCLFLSRNNIRAGMEMIRTSVSYIKEGVSIWICPEGTRNKGTGIQPFKAGSFKIADLTGCPVVPVTLTRTDEIYEQHRPWVRRADVTVQFGAPVETAGMSREEKKALPARIQKIIGETYRKNGGA